jgi:hypothetical protein
VLRGEDVFSLFGVEVLEPYRQEPPSRAQLVADLEQAARAVELGEDQAVALLRTLLELCSCRQSLEMLAGRAREDQEVLRRLEGLYEAGLPCQARSIARLVRALDALLPGQDQPFSKSMQFQLRLICKSLLRLSECVRDSAYVAAELLALLNQLLARFDFEQVAAYSWGREFELAATSLRDLALSLIALNPNL